MTDLDAIIEQARHAVERSDAHRVHLQRATLAVLVAEVDRLRRVIDRYGSHDDDCDAWTDGGCDCGWDAVSAQIPTADEALDGDAS